MHDWWGKPGCGGTPDCFRMLDVGTGFKHSEGVYSKNTLETYRLIQYFRGRDHIHCVYSDNWKSIKKPCLNLGIMWEPSQPGVHHSNAVIERCNQDIMYGARTLMIEAGLPGCYWTYAQPCYCFNENICDSEEEPGISAYYKRFKKHYNGKAFPFGCGVFFKPAPTKYHQAKSWPAMVYGIFLGYQIGPGGKRTGRYLVADLDDFVERDLSAEAASTDHNLYPQVTEQVELGDWGIRFPLKSRYEWYNCTLEGRTASAWKAEEVAEGGTQEPDHIKERNEHLPQHLQIKPEQEGRGPPVEPPPNA